jgi:hypothetical protein
MYNTRDQNGHNPQAFCRYTSFIEVEICLGWIQNVFGVADRCQEVIVVQRICVATGRIYTPAALHSLLCLIGSSTTITTQTRLLFQAIIGLGLMTSLLRSLVFVPRTTAPFFRRSINQHNHYYDSSTHRTMTVLFSLDLLQQQNAETSNALIEHWKDSKDFIKLAHYEGELIRQRDDEDGLKLQKGIDFAKSKGVIDPNFSPQPYVHIDVLGKTPDSVVDEILAKVKEENSSKRISGDAEQKVGSVIVLCGLSGTGKGTTVTRLQKKLEEEEGKQVVTWSNGNIFRSVTLLAVTWCEQNLDGGAFDKEKALTKENLQSFVDMLTFGKFDGQYDTRIHGLGLDMLISQVQNTELKSPKVSMNIPTVAEVTQGKPVHDVAVTREHCLGPLTYICPQRCDRRSYFVCSGSRRDHGKGWLVCFVGRP